jgi:hypothetical protein
VMILNKDKNSGGSGVVLQSEDTGSTILTNGHVCKLLEDGGFVMKNGQQYVVDEYKLSNRHDLCLLRIATNLGVSTKVADSAPDYYSKAYISGHPHLLPHVLTEGNFSGKMPIDLIVALKECNEDTFKDGSDQDKMNKLLMCLFLGGIPVIRTFEAQLVTGTILPGSSGSGIFTEAGEIAGMVFASDSRELSYALAVPYEYVKQFVAKEQDQLSWIPAHGGRDEQANSGKQSGIYPSSPSYNRLRDRCKELDSFGIIQRAPILERVCGMVRRNLLDFSDKEAVCQTTP